MFSSHRLNFGGAQDLRKHSTLLMAPTSIVAASVLLLSVISATTSIVSPVFDMVDIVPVESGQYSIQSADGEYLSRLDYMPLLTSLLRRCQIAAVILTPCVYSASSNFGNCAAIMAGFVIPMIGFHGLVVLLSKDPTRLSSEQDTSWTIEAKDDGSFILKYPEFNLITGELLLHGARLTQHHLDAKFVAVEAGNEGLVPVKKVQMESDRAARVIIARE